MAIGLLLNPLRRGRGLRRAKPRRRNLTPWQKMVKRHGGVMGAVKARRRMKASARKRRRTRGSTAARRGTRVRASRKRTRNPARRAERRKKMARRRRSTRKRARSRRTSRRSRVNPVVRKHRRKSYRRKGYRMPATTVSSALVGPYWRGPGRRPRRFAPSAYRLSNPFALANPVKRSRRRRRRANPILRRRRRSRSFLRRNPLKLGILREFVAKPQLRKYPWLVGGVVAGAVMPRLLVRALQKVKVLESAPAGQLANVGLGFAGTALAGLLASLKGSEEAKLVVGGGVAGVLGNVLIGLIEQYMPMVGLGNAASNVRRAVESQVRRALGDFVTPRDIQAAPVVSGFGDFVTPQDIDAAPVVSGFGQDVGEGAEGFGGFDGDAF